MSMSKKDYELLARAAQEYGRTLTDERREALDGFIILLAHRLKDANPNFDKTRFIMACYGHKLR